MFRNGHSRAPDGQFMHLTTVFTQVEAKEGKRKSKYCVIYNCLFITSLSTNEKKKINVKRGYIFISNNSYKK